MGRDRDPLVRLILRAYPRRMRERHGEQLAELYREMYLRPGWWGRVVFWARLAWDAIPEGIASRIDEVRRSRGTGPGEHKGHNTGAAERRPTSRVSQVVGETPVHESGISEPRGSRGQSARAVIRDLGSAVRSVARSPRFSLVAVFTIGLGVAGTVLIFSVLDAVVLRPLPYAEPDRLAAIEELDIALGMGQTVNPGNFYEWSLRSEQFVEMTAFSTQSIVARLAGAPREILLGVAHWNLFDVLGVPASIGRTFAPGAPASADGLEVVLTDRYWRSAFGADPGVIGQTLDLEGTLTTIVGVLPPVYMVYNGSSVDAWVSYNWHGAAPGTGGRLLRVIGRLRAGASWATARSEMASISAALMEAYPEFNGPFDVTVIPLKERFVAPSRAAVWMLFTAAGLIFIVACANVANLLLVRTLTRARGYAVRVALGATRARLAWSVLGEGLLLAGFGSLLGVLMAFVGLPRVENWAVSSFALPRVNDAAVDARVLLFTIALMVIATGLFTVLPALRATRVKPGFELATRERGASRPTRWVQSTLVVVQVALACVLLVGAGLLLRSFTALTSVDPGFEPDQVVTVAINTYGERYGTGEARALFYNDLITAVSRVPGVASVGGATAIPMVDAGVQAYTYGYADDRPTLDRADQLPINYRGVLGDYFVALGVPLLHGRWFDNRDRVGAAPVVVVSQSVADALWPGEEWTGKRLRFQYGDWQVAEVVGVVGDVRRGLNEDAGHYVYLPYMQRPDNDLVLAIRSSESAAVTPALLRSLVDQIDPAVAMSDMERLDDSVVATVSRERLSSFLTSLFAAVGLVLAAVGIYGVLTFTVSMRVGEIAVRIAVGASRLDIVSMVAVQALRLTVTGLVLGTAFAVLGARTIRGLLFGVAPFDPVALGGAAALLTVLSILAAAAPAARAAGVDPKRTLAGN